MRLVPDQRLQQRDHGRFVIGGSPTSLLRLSAAGAAQVRAWFRGAEVDPGPSTTALARKLVDRGLAHPLPAACRADEPSDAGPTITVIIPVKDDPDGLARSLDSLGPLDAARVHVVVVDDGSDQVAGRSLLPSATTLVELGDNLGPAGARNHGVEHAGADHRRPEILAFVDAGVSISGHDLAALASHFEDPDVVAVAPRIRADGPAGAIRRYEAEQSPLDLGPDPGQVAPGRRLAYVPSACLLVRSAALFDDGLRFDEALRFGEDVDLVWRLSALGVIRYDPSVEAWHPARATIRAFARQRIGYGSSAGPLALRHGRRLAPLRLSTWSVAPVVLVALGHLTLASAATLVSAELLSRRLPKTLPDRRADAVRLTVEGHVAAIRSAGEATMRPWWPLAVVAGTGVPGLRGPVLRLMAIGCLRRLRRRPVDQQLAHLMLGTLDDLAYGAGVWRGIATTITERGLAAGWNASRALLPDIRSERPQGNG